MVVRDIPYATERHPRLLGDLHLPGEGKRIPAILMIHGGGWLNSDKSSLSTVSQSLARIGFAVFSINYRRLTEAPWPACLEDCQTAFRKLHSGEIFEGLDIVPARFVVAGASAGGHLALMTALSQSLAVVDAGLLIAAPTFLEFNSPTSDPFLFSADFYRKFFGRDQNISSEELSESSPLSLVKESSPPLWLIHSHNDRLIPPEHSKRLIKAYGEYGSTVMEYWFHGPDMQHGLWLDNLAPEREMTPAFQAALTKAASELLSFLNCQDSSPDIQGVN